MSQGTAPVASGGHETTPMRSGLKPLPILQPDPEAMSPQTLVTMTLMVSIPVSMLVGALIAAMAFWVLQ
jgi:hypothetical protein